MKQWLWLFVCLWGGAGLLRADAVAVLPFFNIAKSTDLDWIGESLSETARRALSSQGILLRDREDQLEAYRRLTLRPYALLTHASVIKVGETLDVEQIVYGQYTYTPPESGQPKVKGSLRIVAQVLDRKRMRRSPEFQVLGSLEDLTRLQSNLAWQLLQFLQPNPTLSEEAFLELHPPVRVEAMESYTRGMIATRLENRINFLQQAARLDPQFTQSYVELARLYYEKKEYRTAANWLQKVPMSAPGYRERSFLLGLSRYYAGEYAAAASAFQVVAGSMPLNEVLNDLGLAQARANQPDALANLRRAAEGDQTDPAYQFNIGYLLWKKGDFDGAADRFRAVLERDPSDHQASALLERSMQRSGPKPAETKLANLERVKEKYEETAYLQLKTLLEPVKQ